MKVLEFSGNTSRLAWRGAGQCHHKLDQSKEQDLDTFMAVSVGKNKELTEDSGLEWPVELA